MRRSAPTVLTVLGLLLWSGAVDVAPATAATSVPAATLLSRLVVAPESGATSYVRTRFAYPVDADHDCQSTRAEVLIQESSRTVAFSSRSHCVVAKGRWTSYYDGVTVTAASALQIDHLVPLEQAWVSGARTWTAAQRTSYANDLAFGPGLVAVTARLNMSKGARDPARWLPPKAAARCLYALQWVEVKYRWALTIDAAERAALARILRGTCGAQRVAVPTRMITGTAATPGGSTPTPTPTPTPTATPTPSPTPTQSLSCAASMSDSAPARYGRTTVRVVTAAAARVTTVARYRTTATTLAVTADGQGRAGLEYSIGGASAGYRVVVDVTATYGGATARCQTSFTPH